MDWCRLYAKMRNDPNIGTMDDATFRTFVELMMVATEEESDGNTNLTEAGIDWALRRNASVTLHELLHRKLVTVDETGLIWVANWGDLQKRGDSSAERVAKHRANQRLSSIDAPVTLQKRSGNALDKSREDKSREEKPKKTSSSRFDARKHLVDQGVDELVADDWLDLRKRLKAPATETAIDGIEREAKKAGIGLQDALAVSCQRGWRGFSAEWVKEKPRPFSDRNAETVAKLTGRWDYEHDRSFDA